MPIDHCRELGCFCNRQSSLAGQEAQGAVLSLFGLIHEVRKSLFMLGRPFVPPWPTLVLLLKQSNGI